VTTYGAWAQFATTWGLLYFVAMFVGIVIYAYWPRNKARFDAAAQIPLRDDADDAVTEPRA
jgi:cytochrome c oxidase cbb3-type subunit IV